MKLKVLIITIVALIALGVLLATETGCIEINVIDSAGNPVTNAIVRIASDGNIYSGKTDTNGVIIFCDLPYGTYSCSVYIPEQGLTKGEDVTISEDVQRRRRYVVVD